MAKRSRGKVSDGNYPEIKAILDGVKRRNKCEKSCKEIALFVEKTMAVFEIVVEDDAQLNRIGQPAINKLQKLPLLVEVLRKKNLQLEFLDHGVLSLLKSWLEPLPDGSLPNANIIRAAILNILTDFPIDLEQPDRRDQFKKSGLGKVIMFLSKSDEETVSNKKLANDLVEKWSRIIFNKSTKFSDLRSIENQIVPFIKMPEKKPARPAAIDYKEVDLDLDLDFSKKQKQSSQPCSSNQRATMPEVSSSVYLVRPQSNYNPDIAKAYAGHQVRGESRHRIMKRLKKLKG